MICFFVKNGIKNYQKSYQAKISQNRFKSIKTLILYKKSLLSMYLIP